MEQDTETQKLNAVELSVVKLLVKGAKHVYINTYGKQSYYLCIDSLINITSSNIIHIVLLSFFYIHFYNVV